MVNARIVNQAQDYVEDHLSEKIRLEDVAKHLNISPYHFHRNFTKYADETFNTFMLRMKLERSALYLVMFKEVSITTISLNYGFSESSAYARSFKKHYGMSPSEFRKQQDMSRTSLVL
ncbi:helix-turn-helix transcriptional regulator [Erysipelothrix urinaevulpis]|uniref:helix-turn-helix transcriptional regulator n=1 Tax=Erysipelothrix urinaevulpis TaxID=2683717 RepID=UPI00135CA06D|nr:helix-turn-helix transcriptional regulator [Erysipelothrix urinaevulpis]